MGWFRKKSSADLTAELTAKTHECTTKIADKWRYFNEKVPFKKEVPLAQRIEAFSLPIQQFVEDHYPVLLKSPDPGEFFWTMLFTAVLESKTHPAGDVNCAIEVLGQKHQR